jgi:hypothetical protein
VALREGRAGAVALRGRAEIRPAGAEGPFFAGKVSLRGKTPATLKLEGTLAGKGSLAAAEGGAEPALPLRLKVRLGSRLLQGTLASWKLN